MFYKKGVLKNFLRPATLLTDMLRQWCCHVSLGKFLRTPFHRIPPAPASENKLMKIQLRVLSFLLLEEGSDKN